MRNVEMLMPLTDAQVRALVPGDRSYRRSDDRGLYVEVFPNGSKLWRYKHRYDAESRTDYRSATERDAMLDYLRKPRDHFRGLAAARRPPGGDLRSP